MKRVFKTRHFNRWMRKTAPTDSALCTAGVEMQDGLIDADLLELTSAALDAQVQNEAILEICHDCKDPRD